MLQRLRGAIDRSLAEAEELARQRGNTQTRSSATSRPTRPNPDALKEGSDGGLDPAVFEAAFVLDESDTPSRTHTPKPGDDDKRGEVPEQRSEAQTHTAPTLTTTAATTHASAIATPQLTVEVKLKLRKLEKLEATYPELLRSYRIAHGRATSIQSFERALKEHTPLVSIKDTAAFVEYINQLNLKSSMVMDELKRVTAEKDSCKRQLEAQDKELRATKCAKKNESSDAGAAASEPHADDGSPEQATAQSPDPAAVDVPAPQEPLSHEPELPQLQADLAAKTDEIDGLRAEVASLKARLAEADVNRGELSQNLEKATWTSRGLNRIANEQATLNVQLRQRAAEVDSIDTRLKAAQAQLQEARTDLLKDHKEALAGARRAQDKLSKVQTRANNLDTDLKATSLAKEELQTRVNELVAELERERAESQDKMARLVELERERVDSQDKMARLVGSSAASPKPHDATAGSSAGSKKKNRKKKKGGAGSAAAASVSALASPAEDQAPTAETETAGVAALELEIARLRDVVADKDRKIEGLGDDMHNSNMGQEAAQQRIEKLESDKKALEELLAQREQEVTVSVATLRELEALKRSYDYLDQSTQTFRDNLGAAEELAAERDSDITAMCDMLQQVQPELEALRRDSAALKTTRDDLAARTAELRALERRDTNVRAQLARTHQAVTVLQDTLVVETRTRLQLEEAHRAVVRDLHRCEAEKTQASVREQEAKRALEQATNDVASLRHALQDTTRHLQAADGLREQMAIISQQRNDAQGLADSMRAQTAELSLQLKEAWQNAKSFEEELDQVQILLSEQTSQAEALRLRLADVDERAEARVAEMRAQRDAAVAERDRLEDDANSRARQSMREAQELLLRTRKLEGDIREMSRARDEAALSYDGWARHKAELEAAAGLSRIEANESRAAADVLRSSLDQKEQKMRAAEKQLAAMKDALEQQQKRFAKLKEDHDNLRTRVGIVMYGTTFPEDDWIPSQMKSLASSISASAGGTAADLAYIKTVLLQFLEQKDSKMRSQLVPVLGKLLKFDRSDEQKWLDAVEHLEVK